MEVQQAITSLNEFFGEEFGGGIKLAIVGKDDLEFLQVNARYMERKMYLQLVENIKRDKFLSSVPFCWYNDATKRYVVLSGNHRLKAGIDAGIQKFVVLYTDRELEKQEQIAIQLSHNAIEGKDDIVILKELWSQVMDIDWKQYVGFDDQVLKDIESVKLETITPPAFKTVVVPFVFFEGEENSAIDALTLAETMAGELPLYCVPAQAYDYFLATLAAVDKRFNIQNITTKLLKMCAIVNEVCAQGEAVGDQPF